ncbi:protein translocase subunit SecF [Marinobacter nanhaiticus D15-8W]|uniref:Protein-export membrane protein SecF n=1 Tax=Marinobacter nanhaiticus D15-8W TaxID=626887 RepID=N6W110_9GAMM|nr:protein translocase subunit SecF [Marinobacter nanhaiticus]ENO13794.1 protein translocase subunit SecF [Marinobacter nanhaiticus D15-8W]BES71167.1 protein translocase subunit SecF [Marinobacter nanhaiticus D15-8W]
MAKLTEKTINFMGIRRIASVISLASVALSIVILAVNGLNLGLDFTGGTSVEFSYEQAPSLDEVRQTLEEAGYEEFVVQNFGEETSVLVRLRQDFDDELATRMTDDLRATGDNLEMVRAEFVGSQVGDQLKEDSGLGLLLALFVVLIYVGMRFQFKFGVASVLPLAHDVLVVLGIFSLFQWTFDLSVLAALLAVIGYSLNDTIIVSDRIRENFRKLRTGTTEEVVNHSITETLSRTLNTSGTTLVVLLSLYFLGGEAIHNFAVALLIGIIVGTYSSIYVSANLLILLGVTRDDLIVPPKEGAAGQEEDERPPEWLNRM